MTCFMSSLRPTTKTSLDLSNLPAAHSYRTGSKSVKLNDLGNFHP